MFVAVLLPILVTLHLVGSNIAASASKRFYKTISLTNRILLRPMLIESITALIANERAIHTPGHDIREFTFETARPLWWTKKTQLIIRYA